MTSHPRLAPAILTAALALGIASSVLRPTYGQCVHWGVGGVTVGLEPPTANTGVLARREHAFLSDLLAQDLGIRPYDPKGPFTFTPGASVNPQVRVVVTSPTIDGRESSAAFTVAGVFTAPSRRLRVYASLGASDKDSGQFKLFKDAAPQDVDLTQTDANGDVVGVAAKLTAIAVSTSTVEESGSSTTTVHFCEPAANGGDGFTEEARIAPDKRVVLLVPHGAGIEVKTSDQIDPILAALEADWSVDANLWEGRGTWGLDQTFARWHVTATALYPRSFLALQTLLDRPDFGFGVPFRHAVALHGYASNDKGIIVGGRASREAKCLVVRRIQQELLSWRGDDREIGFHIEDAQGDLAIPSSGGHVPPSGVFGGQDPDNLVNRLAPGAAKVSAPGGIQLEQSTAVRTDETDGEGGSGPAVQDAWLRYVVARGVAEALGELATDVAPAQACAPYLP